MGIPPKPCAEGDFFCPKFFDAASVDRLNALVVLVFLELQVEVVAVVKIKTDLWFRNMCQSLCCNPVMSRPVYQPI